MKVAYVRLAALAIYVISFFLPAIRWVDNSTGNTLPGWGCAWFANGFGARLVLQSFNDILHPRAIMLLMGGVTNYLFVAIFILSFWPHLRRARLVLAALMIPCFIAAWMFLASSQMAPLIGHFLWVAACLLVAAPDIVALSRHKHFEAACASSSQAPSPD